MAIIQKELARRLKTAREASRLTQDQVAAHLDVSRSTIAQMELGNRAVTSLELKRLADLYSRDLADFLADEFDEANALVALFRLHPDVAENPTLHEVLRRCAALGREATSLEKLLNLDKRRVRPAEYEQETPRGSWEAIQQGEHLANVERRRLNLGYAPVCDVPEILEPQGVRCAEVEMPEDVSGLFMAGSDLGLFVIVNARHHVRRRAFSYAHEYSHLLVDRSRRGKVSRQADRDELMEVRANAFAAAFLLPEDAVRDFLGTTGKGRESRAVAAAYDGSSAVVAQHRVPPGSQDLQLYDVVRLAHRFGVSFQSAVYRLRNLRLLTENAMETLLARGEDAVELQRTLDLADPEERPDRRRLFRHQFMNLALDAYRRELISRRKLGEMGHLLDLDDDALDQLLRRSGLDVDVQMGAEDVRLPE
jgi:Zn-dependent peptidase ImmA (M78 family)/transcriptional regulator with XRE-family HTH domain